MIDVAFQFFIHGILVGHHPVSERRQRGGGKGQGGGFFDHIAARIFIGHLVM